MFKFVWFHFILLFRQCFGRLHFFFFAFRFYCKSHLTFFRVFAFVILHIKKDAFLLANATVILTIIRFCSFQHFYDEALKVSILVEIVKFSTKINRILRMCDTIDSIANAFCLSLRQLTANTKVKDFLVISSWNGNKKRFFSFLFISNQSHD